MSLLYRLEILVLWGFERGENQQPSATAPHGLFEPGLGPRKSNARLVGVGVHADEFGNPEPRRRLEHSEDDRRRTGDQGVTLLLKVARQHSEKLLGLHTSLLELTLANHSRPTLPK